MEDFNEFFSAANPKALHLQGNAIYRTTNTNVGEKINSHTGQGEFYAKHFPDIYKNGWEILQLYNKLQKYVSTKVGFLHNFIKPHLQTPHSLNRLAIDSIDYFSVLSARIDFLKRIIIQIDSPIDSTFVFFDHLERLKALQNASLYTNELYALNTSWKSFLKYDFSVAIGKEIKKMYDPSEKLLFNMATAPVIDNQSDDPNNYLDEILNQLNIGTSRVLLSDSKGILLQQLRETILPLVIKLDKVETELQNLIRDILTFIKNRLMLLKYKNVSEIFIETMDWKISSDECFSSYTVNDGSIEDGLLIDVVNDEDANYNVFIDIPINLKNDCFFINLLFEYPVNLKHKNILDSYKTMLQNNNELANSYRDFQFVLDMPLIRIRRSIAMNDATIHCLDDYRQNPSKYKNCFTKTLLKKQVYDNIISKAQMFYSELIGNAD